jgi:glycosyltransferase involved in cell wall biosynthesis
MMKERQLSMSAIASHATGDEPNAVAFQPVRMLDVEISQPLQPISAYDERTKQRYQCARLLVYLHTQPLGMVDLSLDGDSLSADIYADHIWRTLRQAINDHLRRDGLPEVDNLGVAGLPYSDEPLCMQERTRFLAEAPFVSVIVCTRDRVDQLATCLLSLLALEYPRYEIIVVDNAPNTSATADLVRECYGHLAQVGYAREDRPGLSWARNCGLRHAQGEIVAFIDDDEMAAPYWLAEIAKGFRAADNVACVTGMIVPREIETQAQDWFEQFGGHSKGRRIERFIANTTTHRVPHPIYPIPAFGAGGNMAFKTSVIRALGGFDTTLGAGTFTFGGEDTAAFFYVITQGYTLVFEPAVLVRHLHHRDYASLCKQLCGYGVGLTAYFSRCLYNDPKCIFDLMSILPLALHYLLSPRSERHIKMRPDYPKELHRFQYRGMLYGPLAYLRSRWHLRRIVKQYGPLEAT